MHTNCGEYMCTGMLVGLCDLHIGVVTIALIFLWDIMSQGIEVRISKFGFGLPGGGGGGVQLAYLPTL